ncbi:MAG: zinc ribbon domain-containing protein [Candidatus Aenigmarchaeota archaeon]|nr:zinc ribbon domain-containing protein [Candidatus Aenigmarchaeota archaeon]
MVEMYCHRCGKKVDEHWDFCPSCGAKVMRPVKFERPSPLFSSDNIFSSFKKQLDEMNRLMSMDMKNMEKDFEVFDLKNGSEPKIKRNGFSVSIRSGTDRKPQINIKTFGDVDKKKLHEELSKRFGIKLQNMPEKTGAIKAELPAEKMQGSKIKEMPKITEEPKTDIKRLPDKIIIETNLPDVESEDDIIVHTLPESIELKAIGKKKMYFRIMQIPKGWQLISKTFKDSKLKLEFRPRS